MYVVKSVGIKKIPGISFRKLILGGGHQKLLPKKHLEGGYLIRDERKRMQLEES